MKYFVSLVLVPILGFVVGWKLERFFRNRHKPLEIKEKVEALKQLSADVKEYNANAYVWRRIQDKGFPSLNIKPLPPNDYLFEHGKMVGEVMRMDDGLYSASCFPITDYNYHANWDNIEGAKVDVLRHCREAQK